MSELKHEKGKVFVNGTLSYASQEPWIFSGTIRDNILLGQPYDKKRYAKVRSLLQLVALVIDLNLKFISNVRFELDKNHHLFPGCVGGVSQERLRIVFGW